MSLRWKGFVRHRDIQTHTDVTDCSIHTNRPVRKLYPVVVIRCSFNTLACLVANSHRPTPTRGGSKGGQGARPLSQKSVPH